jgi:hypothetical protein
MSAATGWGEAESSGKTPGCFSATSVLMWSETEYRSGVPRPVRQPSDSLNSLVSVRFVTYFKRRGSPLTVEAQDSARLTGPDTTWNRETISRK